jgi:hypothetical protein
VPEVRPRGVAAIAVTRPQRCRWRDVFADFRFACLRNTPMSGSPSNSNSTDRTCSRSRIACCLDTHVPDPIIRAIGREDEGPEADAMLADSVGLALLVVLEKLDPAERLVFVLHDVFGMTFEEIAPIVDRSVGAARQLASRARRRIRGQTPTSDADLRTQRRVVDAFLAAVQKGDFEALVTSWIRRLRYEPRAERRRACRGSCVAEAVGAQAAAFSRLGLSNQVVLVNGNIGIVSRLPDGRVLCVHRIHDCGRQGR